MGGVDQARSSEEVRRKRRRGRVPVSSRDKRPRPRRRIPIVRLNLLEFAVILAVVLFILFAVAVPLRNYFQGATELARLNQSIEELSQQKGELQSEIEDYHSDAYIEEQARQRLGVIGEGETAYRIIDPYLESDTGASDGASESAASWWRVLWDSISDPGVQPEPSTDSTTDTEASLTPEPTP